jgi:hypothetical protein
MTDRRRINIKRILADPILRKELFIDCLIATQAREGIETNREQAEEAYNKVMENERNDC